jgi:hypothetical protein
VEPSTYGERIADVYDDWYADATDVDGTVATVLRYGGPVLELGIGTGRLALPMVAAGLVVHGVDASPAMVERLRAKPGGDAIPVTIGDFADVPVEGAYGVALLAFNALLNLTNKDAQVRCLRRCGQLADRVITETLVPGDDAPANGLEVRHVDADEVRLSAYRIEDGVVSGSFVSITEAGVRLRPWTVRLALPDELDRVALAAGLVVESRWSGWREEPFVATSERAVTVYRRE